MGYASTTIHTLAYGEYGQTWDATLEISASTEEWDGVCLEIAVPTITYVPVILDLATVSQVFADLGTHGDWAQEYAGVELEDPADAAEATMTLERDYELGTLMLTLEIAGGMRAVVIMDMTEHAEFCVALDIARDAAAE